MPAHLDALELHVTSGAASFAVVAARCSAVAIRSVTAPVPGALTADTWRADELDF